MEAARLKMQAEPQTGPAAGVSRSTTSLGRAGVAATVRPQAFDRKFKNRGGGHTHTPEFEASWMHLRPVLQPIGGSAPQNMR
jgi:hypothetical protein